MKLITAVIKPFKRYDIARGGTDTGAAKAFVVDHELAVRSRTGKAGSHAF
jgi:nitrogen regulatory protein PII